MCVFTGAFDTCFEHLVSFCLLDIARLTTRTGYVVNNDDLFHRGLQDGITVMSFLMVITMPHGALIVC